MKTLTVKLPEELYAELATAAAKRRESKSCLVREAIASYMRDDGGRDADLSCDDLAQDLVGSFSGPVDLSRGGKKYMKRYGR